MFEIIAFYIFAALTIGMFAIVVMSRNALYSMSALAGGMIFISGFFFILDAEFLGVVQIVVYSGAIMALYAFGMMFFDTTRDVSEKMRSKKIAYTLSVISAIK
jgi:NADH-quinone oxidoreductase subunit J